MAAAGGHWVKIGGSSGFAGQMAFVPAVGDTTVTINGYEYTAVKSGNMYAGHLAAENFGENQGKWQVFYMGKDGKPHALGEGSIMNSKQEAIDKINNMQAQGMTKAINTDNAFMINNINSTAKAQLATPGAKTVAKTAKPKVAEPGAKTTKTEAKTSKEYSTQADFDNNKGPVTVTTSYYKNKVEVEGVMLDSKGEYAVTYNQHTGQYHLVEMAGGTTVATFKTPGEAFKAGNTALANNKPAPSNPNFKNSETIYGNVNQANAVFAKHYASQYKTLDGSEVQALSNYQDNHYGQINGNLWGANPHATPTIKAIDSAISKSPGLPHNTILYRKKSTGTELYQWAQKHGVGDVYASKGYDSTSISTSGWHGNVTLVYRAPAGLKGFFMNTNGYNSSHPGEYEYLLPRNQKWSVVGKKVNGSNIEMTLEYLGEF